MDDNLQKRINLLPDANEILFKQTTGLRNGAYFIGKPKNKKDRNNTWQANHRLIIEYIERALDALRRLPTVKEISKELRISRVTVHAHLKDYKTNPAYELERGMINLMAERILLEALRKANDLGTTPKDLKDALTCYRIMNPISSTDIVLNNWRVNINVFNSLPEKEKFRLIESVMKGSNV